MIERAVRARRDAIHAEYLDEEAEADDAEAVENDQGVLSVRVPAVLAETLKARATQEHVPTSALIRRIFARTVQEDTEPVLTVEQVEEIARRFFRKSA